MATLAAEQSALGPWRAIAAAMGKTGGVALLSGLLTMLATKLLAVMLGPGPIAQLGSLQQLRQVGLTAATLGGQTALIQGASALNGEARREFLRTTLLLTCFAILVTAGVLWAAPGWVVSQIGLSESDAGPIRWMAAVIGMGALSVYGTGLLTAERSIDTLAAVQLVGPLAVATLAVPVAWAAGGSKVAWLVGLLGIGAAVTWGAAMFPFLRRNLRGHLAGTWWSAHSAQRFFRITGAMLVSALFSHAVMVLTRARVLRTEGLDVGGHFDAAWAISMSQTGLILASLQSFYLPTLASERTPHRRKLQIVRVLTLACLAAALGIAAITAMKPLFVKTLYSAAFMGASRFLRWTLAGDYLKVSSWILSIPFIANGDMRSFLTGDLLAYATFGVAAWILTARMGAAEAAAAAFVLMYAVHFSFCCIRLWTSGEFRPGPSVAATWFGGAAMVATSSFVFWNQ